MQKNTDITTDYTTLYHPVMALMIYQAEGVLNDTYVESFDISKDGHPINAHPLSVSEATQLAAALTTHRDSQPDYLKPHGLLPQKVLHIDQGNGGKVTWYTPAGYRQMHFTEQSDIPSGKAAVPALLWMASANRLYLYALKSNRRPTLQTELFNAPFLNVYDNGGVCTGTVDVAAKKAPSLEAFMTSWEEYFFNSYFSHLLHTDTVNGNCVTLWKDLIATGKPFPKEALQLIHQTIKNILL